MNRIEHLIPTTLIPDREQMLREALTDRVLNWIGQSYFDICPLEEFRAIADDVQGRPASKKAVPQDLRTLHCVNFSSLSVANRRAAIESALMFIGAGEELFGSKAWLAIEARVADKCAGPDDSPKASHDRVLALATRVDGIADADSWTLDTIAEKVGGLFDGSSFYVSRVREVHSALNALRERASIPALDPLREDLRWEALKILGSDAFDGMSLRTREGLLDAVEGVLGLAHAETAALLGGERLRAARGKLGVDFISEMEQAADASVDLERERRRSGLWNLFVMACRRWVGLRPRSDTDR